MEFHPLHIRRVYEFITVIFLFFSHAYKDSSTTRNGCAIYFMLINKEFLQIMDSFKIVCTKEEKGIFFSAVPSRWEYNGLLFWPDNLNYAQREALRSDRYSKPEKEWTQYNCIVKQFNIPNFKEAMKLEKLYSECDTDAEELLFNNSTRKRTATAKAGYDQTVDRNDLFISQEQENVVSNLNAETSEVLVENANLKNIMLVEDDMIKLITKNIGSLLENVEHISKDLQEVKNKCTNLTEQYCKLNVYLDKIYKIVIKDSFITANQNKEEKMIGEIEFSKFHFPLGTVEQISNLEKNIKKYAEFRTCLVNELTKLGGKSGQQDGTK